MLGGLAAELLVLATYIKSVDVVQPLLLVHWFSGGKKPHPVDTAARHGASTRATARNFFQKFSMMGCIPAISRRNHSLAASLIPILSLAQRSGVAGAAFSPFQPISAQIGFQKG
jgi:hypothetical protein